MRVLISILVIVMVILLFSLTQSQAATQCGGVSWYGEGHHGRKTASGERFNMNAMTAAHKTLPMGTVVRVHLRGTGATVKVTINDRGPYVRGRIIDVSKAAARRLGLLGPGVARGCITY